MIAFIFYFSMVWFFPWEGFRALPSVSSVYLFDLSFIIILSLAYGIRIKVPVIRTTIIAKELLYILVLAFLSIGSIFLFKIKTPFKYVENVILQMLILAPIIEELVYRHVLTFFLQRRELSDSKVSLVSGLVFSFSHAVAFMSLPSDFYPFIICQLIYTFALGFVCSMSRLSSKSVVNPILLHFIFNLIFWISLT